MVPDSYSLVHEISALGGELYILAPVQHNPYNDMAFFSSNQFLRHWSRSKIIHGYINTVVGLA